MGFQGVDELIEKPLRIGIVLLRAVAKKFPTHQAHLEIFDWLNR
jgi:hypothetical protein